MDFSRQGAGRELPRMTKAPESETSLKNVIITKRHLTRFMRDGGRAQPRRNLPQMCSNTTNAMNSRLSTSTVVGPLRASASARPLRMWTWGLSGQCQVYRPRLRLLRLPVTRAVCRPRRLLLSRPDTRNFVGPVCKLRRPLLRLHKALRSCFPPPFPSASSAGLRCAPNGPGGGAGS